MYPAMFAIRKTATSLRECRLGEVGRSTCRGSTLDSSMSTTATPPCASVRLETRDLEVPFGDA
jgi:hypothetical protein